MVVINDVMAYMFGFFFGRTPLIQLSPKKTWEGFIGGGVSLKKKINITKKRNSNFQFFFFFFQISTVIIALGLGHFACQYSYLTCPIGKLQNVNKQLTQKCKQKKNFFFQNTTKL